MNNKIIYLIGFIILSIYTYFLFSIIKKQNKHQSREQMNVSDLNDLDGMGNQGRFPNKKPRNRAI